MVIITLPAFDSANPDLWFAKVEKTFNLHKITEDSVKYDLLQTSIISSYIAKVRKSALKPSSRNKYETLKKGVIMYFEEEKLKQSQILNVGGDRRPSELLQHIRNMAESSTNEDFIRLIWLLQLPDSLQEIISPLKGWGLDRLAAVADVLTSSGNLTSEMCNRMTKMMMAVNVLKTSIEECVQDATQPQQQPLKRLYNSRYCYYHNKFDDQARNCTGFCQFPRK